MPALPNFSPPALKAQSEIDWPPTMSAAEFAELCVALPPDKREEVADFARFLLARDTWLKLRRGR